MCHKAPNPSSPTHAHTHKYTLLRWRKRGSRGDRKDGVEDWGWGGMGGGGDRQRCASWCRAPKLWLILYHLSRQAHTHIYTETHTHRNSPPSLLSQPLIPRVCVHMHMLTCTQKHWYTHAHTYAGVTVRQMTGGSSQCNSPSWPNTDSSRHLRQLPLSQWKEPIWNWCQKKSNSCRSAEGSLTPKPELHTVFRCFYFTREDCSTVFV